MLKPNLLFKAYILIQVLLIYFWHHFVWYFIHLVQSSWKNLDLIMTSSYDDVQAVNAVQTVT